MMKRLIYWERRDKMLPTIKPPPSSPDFKVVKIIFKNSGYRIEIGGYISEIKTLEDCIKNNVSVAVIMNGNIIRSDEVAALLR